MCPAQISLFSDDLFIKLSTQNLKLIVLFQKPTFSISFLLFVNISQKLPCHPSQKSRHHFVLFPLLLIWTVMVLFRFQLLDVHPQPLFFMRIATALVLALIINSLPQFFQYCPLIHFLKILFIYFWRGEVRKRGTETSMCGCFSRTPCQGPGLQPRHVLWLGIKLATLWFAGQCSIHWATPAKVSDPFFSYIATGVI